MRLASYFDNPLGHLRVEVLSSGIPFSKLWSEPYELVLSLPVLLFPYSILLGEAYCKVCEPRRVGLSAPPPAWLL